MGETGEVQSVSERPEKENQAKNFTCFTRVDDKLCRLEGSGFAQALTAHTHSAGIADLRLADHHRYGAAGDMATVLLDVHQVLASLLRNEGNTCKGQRKNNKSSD